MQFEKTDSGHTIAPGALFAYEIMPKGKKYALDITKGEQTERLTFQDFGGAKLYAIEHDKKAVKELAKSYGYKECLLSQISEWGKLARPNPTNQDKAVQFGYAIEEMSELMFNTKFITVANTLDRTAKLYKAYKETLNIKNHVGFFDACLDIIVTLIILMDLLGYNWRSGLEEVVKSNYSKFENGEPIFDDNGKITKGKDYIPPNLEPFIPVNNIC